MSTMGIPCALMRGGTSKGVVFLAADLPDDDAERNALLLRIMGSPDNRQIDGLGGAHPLTSKVAVVSPSTDPASDVDYLFLQVAVDRPIVSSSQTCGNMLAAVAPFAVERRLVPAQQDYTDVRVRLVNTSTRAVLRIQTPGCAVTYEGITEITGVPGTAAPVEIVAESPDTPLLPTGNVRDNFADCDVTCIDNGMPSVLVNATDLGHSGIETPQELEADTELLKRVHFLRAAAADAMGLTGDLASTTVPKVVLVAPPARGGTISTRSFIPDRVHQAIGVLGAASVAAATRLDGSIARTAAHTPSDQHAVRIEHPTGHLDVLVTLGPDPKRPVAATSVIRTARTIFDGAVYPGPSRDTHPIPHTPPSEPGASP